VLAGPVDNGFVVGATRMRDYWVLRYRGVVVFTGACMLASTVCVGVKLGPGRLRAVCR
jgi:hypothetical protein